MSLNKPPQDFSTPQSLERSARKRPVSERRIQANRQNALRSTGPRTASGKRNVSRNAIKHGILAREVVITAGDGKESLKEFHDLAEKLCELYEPVGVVEESLVQTIATCWWRKARVIRAENGEIRKRLGMVVAEGTLRNLDKGNFGLALLQMEFGLFSSENQADQKVSSRDRWSAIQLVQKDLRGHHSGLEYLRTLLERAKSEIASDGYISERIRKEILDTFCFWDYLFASLCYYSGPPEGKMEDRLSEGSG
jgi:hypothetical protein